MGRIFIKNPPKMFKHIQFTQCGMKIIAFAREVLLKLEQCVVYNLFALFLAVS